jgi:hypothetical protein
LKPLKCTERSESNTTGKIGDLISVGSCDTKSRQSLLAVIRYVEMEALFVRLVGTVVVLVLRRMFERL